MTGVTLGNEDRRRTILRNEGILPVAPADEGADSDIAQGIQPIATKVCLNDKAHVGELAEQAGDLELLDLRLDTNQFAYLFVIKNFAGRRLEKRDDAIHHHVLFNPFASALLVFFLFLILFTFLCHNTTSFFLGFRNNSLLRLLHPVCRRRRFRSRDIASIAPRSVRPAPS